MFAACESNDGINKTTVIATPEVERINYFVPV